MAVYDQSAERVVVRVVYDGPGFAGKTTNLEQLCRFFSEQRRSALFRGDQQRERTLYLDWVQLEGGVVAGYKLGCQLITVPGQTALSRRRWQLLGGADAVVFVLESSASGVERAAGMWRSLCRYTDSQEPELALLVQANKQDAVGAWSTQHVAQALQTSPERVVPAAAHLGNGVRETAVLAIRAAARRVQLRILQEGVEALRGSAKTGEELMKEMMDHEASHPMRPLEIVTRQWRDVGEQQVLERSANAESDRSPNLPLATVPSGFIWPSSTGRDILRRVPIAEATLRQDLTGQIGTRDGSGKSDVMIFEAGIWCLKTSHRRSFQDVDHARTALLLLARQKLALGSLLAKHTVLTLQAGDTGNYWLWTVTPWLTTLRATMQFGATRRDSGSLERALGNFADAAILSLRLALRRGITLDVHPSNFASLGSELCYLDDDIREGSQIPTIGHALVRRVEEYRDWPRAVMSYVEYLGEQLQTQFSRNELRQLQIHDSLSAAATRSSLGLQALDRLKRAVPSGT